ncbi:sister chromatid cohesion protein 1 [Asimina triloba]
MHFSNGIHFHRILRSATLFYFPPVRNLQSQEARRSSGEFLGFWGDSLLKPDRGRCRRRRFLLRAVGEFGGGRAEVVKLKAETGKLVGRMKAETGKLVGRLGETISAFPSVNLRVDKNISRNFGIGLFIGVAFLVVAVRQIMSTRRRYNQHGSVADLVKRGQLRSDRRGISTPLRYDDPFDNPLVKVDKSKATVEMCGKVYRLAQVSLTEEQQSVHQKRRSRAYQWKRPTTFLKEGDPVPPDVDPDTVRWIPANHPFATTVNDIDEDMAQNNVFQKDGVPFRIKAEHEALQRKLEALQNEQKLDKIRLDPGSIRDFERPYKSIYKQQQEQVDQISSSSHHPGHANNPKNNGQSDSLDNNTQTRELPNP